MADLRCDDGHVKFAEVGPGWLDIKCKSRNCGWAPGRVVIHRFDSKTWKMIKTDIYREPTQSKEGKDVHTVRPA